MLAYHEFAPDPRLADFVKCIWTLEGTGGTRQRILPDGSHELVFHFADPFVHDGDRQPRAVFVGEIERATIVEPAPRVDVVGVRFRVGGASAFLRDDLRALTRVMLPATERFPDVGAVFDVRRESRVTAIEQMLLRSLRVPHRWLTLRAAERMLRQTTKVRHVAQRIGITERTLERLFDRCVGMTPKTYARLMRFHAHLRDPLGDAGYVDASHLRRDVLAFAGVQSVAPGEGELTGLFLGF